MSFSRKVRQAISLPPHIIIKKVFELSKKYLKKNIQRKKDYRQCTYSLNYRQSGKLSQYILWHTNNSIYLHKTTIYSINNYFFRHEFDILGSGWTSCNYGAACKGVSTYNYSSNVKSAHDVKITDANKAEHIRIRNLIDKNYSFIDWQRDCKSGYRWSESLWYKDNTYGGVNGVDVKVPWELARCHHSIYLAYGYKISTNQEEAERYAHEFRNQILDFIAFNPPRFGVNWVTSMDVGIRVANWLTAYDLFIGAGYCFDKEFTEVFTRSIYEHGYHIMNNLEWSADLRGNHYLADCVGVLYCAAYLPSTPEIDAWLAFAVQEISAEILLQFLPDGGNFEASVPYHRLSLEMTLFAVGLILHLPKEKIKALTTYNHRFIKGKPRLSQAPLALYAVPDNILTPLEKTPLSPAVFERLKNAIIFTHTMVHFADQIPQIGDNDSGRFMKLTPEYIIRNNILSEKENTHDHLLGLASTIFLDKELEKFRYNFLLENLYEKHEYIPEKCEISSGHTDKKHFPDFGITIYKKTRYSCAIRAGSIGQKGKGGHAHNDQLSCIIAVDGHMLFVDPGTYLYTPLWQERNRFRSTSMHNTLSVKSMEQNHWVSGPGDVLFWMLGDKARAQTLEHTETTYKGEQYGFGSTHQRILQFTDTDIIGRDICDISKEKSLHFHIAPGWNVEQITPVNVQLFRHEIHVEFSADLPISVQDSVFSEGYGKIQQTAQLVIPMKDSTCTWTMTILR